jgi:tRNA 2-thiouridine synthesizing protein E
MSRGDSHPWQPPWSRQFPNKFGVDKQAGLVLNSSPSKNLPFHLVIGAGQMNTQIPERDGDGYLTDMNAWTPDIAKAMAQEDEFEMTDEKWQQILKAREYYNEFNVVPPIRKFSKYLGEDKKAMFELWLTGPMKPITKYGGLPKPTGCV